MIFILFGLGLIFGSFINALVWRLHEQSRPRAKKSKKAREEYSILKGRSMCPHCHHTLAASDLVPVLSWLALGGKCRYCHKPISRQYPLVELLTGFLLALVYWAHAPVMHGVVSTVYILVFVVFFVTLAVYDSKWFLLPDRLVFSLTAVAASKVIVLALLHHSWGEVWQAVFGAAIIFGLFWGIYQASEGAWIGGGDVKLALALGLIAGTPLRALMVIFFASFFGTLASIPLILKGKKGMTQHVPFGPYLLLACLMVVLCAEPIISWYQRVFL